MKVMLFGATGMIGQGVLRECLLDPDVEEVRSVVRGPSGMSHEKLREIVHGDFLDYSAIQDRLSGVDACFFSLGVSAAGMSEEDYTRVTYGFALAAAAALLKQNPGLTFVYVSGQGTDSSEQGTTMWARVKGRTENALLAMPFKTVCMFRPGVIQPMHGAVSKTRLYRILYAVLWPFLPLLKWIAPNQITTTVQLGRAMLQVAKRGAPKPVLETRDITRF